METRAQKARALAREMGWLGAGMSIINLALGGRGLAWWEMLLVPPISFVLSFLIAFPLAFAFPRMAEGRELTELERRQRFARIRPYLGPGFVILLVVLVWLAFRLINFFYRAV